MIDALNDRMMASNSRLKLISKSAEQIRADLLEIRNICQPSTLPVELLNKPDSGLVSTASAPGAPTEIGRQIVGNTESNGWDMDLDDLT